MRVPRPAARTSISSGFSGPVESGCSLIRILLRGPASKLRFPNTNSRPRLLAASDYHTSKARRVMADHLAVVQQIRPHDFSLRMKGNRIRPILKANLIGAVGAILFGLLVTDRTTVEEQIVEANLWRVLRYRFQMPTYVVAVRFAGLSHQIAYENLGCGCFSDGVCHSSHEQVRNDTGVQGSGTNRNHVSRANCGERFRERQTLLRLKP